MNTNINTTNTINTRISVPSDSIQVYGVGHFCGAVAIALEEIPKWELVNTESGGIRLVSEDDTSTMTVFLDPTDGEPYEGEITCVLWIAGEFYKPSASYLYETNNKREMINFI